MAHAGERGYKEAGSIRVRNTTRSQPLLPQTGAVGLQVKNLFLPRAEPVRKAGLRIGDVVLAADGKTGFANEGEFLAYVRLEHPPGDRVSLSVLRAGQRLDLTIPMW